MSWPVARQPRSYSVAPAPRPTERSIFLTERALRGREFDSLDAVNDFLASEEGRRAMETAPPGDSWERAQDLAYDAWEAAPPRRYQLARQALEADGRCSDAWLILAEEERSWRKQRRCFERAVAAAEQYGRALGLLDAAGLPVERGEEGERKGIYGEIPGRAYLRALVALARCHLEGGYPREARALLEQALALDPEDHMGVRFELVPVYHELGDLAGLKALLERCPEDGLAPLPYERLWLALAEGAGQEVIAPLAAAALEVNAHVPAYLLGDAVWPGPLPEYIRPGGEDEAASYAAEAARWWKEEPAAREWLLRQREQNAGSPGESRS